MKLQTCKEKVATVSSVKESLDNDPGRVDDVPDSELRRRQMTAALGPLVSVYVSYVAAVFNLIHSTRVMSSFPTRTLELMDLFLSGNLAMCLSYCVSGIVMTKLGRKKALMLVFPVAAIGCTLTGYADTSLAWQYLARIVSCCSVGLSAPLVPIYISEISDNVYRSNLLCLVNLKMMSGIILTWSLYSYLGQASACIFAVTSMLLWTVCFASRESPVWLLQEGRREEAVSHWTYLRGQKPWDQFHDLEQESERNRQHNESKPTLFAKTEYTILSSQFARGLALVFMFMFTFQFSGFAEILSYVYLHVESERKLILSIIGLICVGASVLFCYLMPRYNRRTLTLISGLGTIASLVLIIVFGWLDMTGFVVIVSSVFYFSFIMLGLLPLSQVIACELLPQRAKVLGSVLAFIFRQICIMTNINGMMELNTLTIGSAMFNTILMLIGITYLYRKLPETKDKTLTEIETLFDNREKSSGEQNGEVNLKV